MKMTVLTMLRAGGKRGDSEERGEADEEEVQKRGKQVIMNHIKMLGGFFWAHTAVQCVAAVGSSSSVCLTVSWNT